MRFLDTLSSYLPSLIVHQLVENEEETTNAPLRQTYDTVCLFCDVSGFTALSEAMEHSGQGAEGLAYHLNSYFGMMCRMITAGGGDIFKFAGDACIVLWPNTDTMNIRVLRAAQCAYTIQTELHECVLADNVTLSVKCGIGIGNVSVLHIGGVLNRMEYLAVGEPLLQAFQAEHHAVSGQIIVSDDAWVCVKDNFKSEEIFSDGYVRLIDAKNNPDALKAHVKKKNIMSKWHADDMLDSSIETKIKQYITGAVLPNLNPEAPDDEKWGNELRKVCVMFVNLGLKEQQLLAAARYDEAMRDVHTVLCEVQKSVYQYEGAINKFLMDDKGSTLIACFGLPPGAHENDCERGVLAALKVCEKLYDLNLSASCGLTYGEVFCGIIGNRVRREYTVLGDCVNLSARLMQRATSEGGGIICDASVADACGASLLFTELDAIHVKGKSDAVKIFRTYPNDREKYPLPTPVHHGGNNAFRPIYRAQKEYYTAQRTLSFLQMYLRHNSLRVAALKNGTGYDTSTKGKGRGGNGSPMRTRKASAVYGGSYGSDGGGNKYKEFKPTDSGPLLGSPLSFGDDSRGSIGGGRRMSGAMARNPIRRNSVLNMLTPQQDGKNRKTTLSHHQPKIHRPTLTPSGLVPIHHATSSGAFGFDRLSSVGEGYGRMSIDESADEDDSFLSGLPGGAGGGRRGSLLSGGVAADYQIFVTVPNELRIEKYRYDSPYLPPINLSDISDFEDLRNRVVRLSILGGHVRDDEKDGLRVALMIMGTRCFLPDENFDVRYLPAFIACSLDMDIDEDDLDMAMRNSDMFSSGGRSGSTLSNVPNTVGRNKSSVGISGGGVRAKTIELMVIKEMDKLNVQNRVGVVKRRLLEHKIRLVDEGKGGVVILEGEPGCGKTELLASFVARTLPNTAAVYVTHGASFCGHVKAFGVWGVIVQQFLDMQVTILEKEGVLSSEGGIVERRTKVLIQELEDSFAEEESSRYRWLLQYAYLMNEICSVDAPRLAEEETPSSRAKEKKDVNLIVKALLFRMIKRMATYKSSIIIFDDAMHLSHESWSLALAVTNFITGGSKMKEKSEEGRLLLIFSMRPMSHYRSRYETVSPDYEDLTEADHVSFLKLGGMPPEEVEDLICKKLGSNVRQISQDLFQFLEERAIGNPSIAVEIVNALQSMREALVYSPIGDHEGSDEEEEGGGGERTVSDDAAEKSGRGIGGRASIIMSSLPGSMLSGSPGMLSGSPTESENGGFGLRKRAGICMEVGLSKDFDPNKMPYLKKVMSTLGARLDRLNSCQQGILKVASSIAKFYQKKLPRKFDGLTFTWSALKEVYPVAGHRAHLASELEALDDSGIFMMIRREENDLTGMKDYVFRFSYAAMCDCVQSRMLKDQKIHLEEAVAKYETSMDKARRSQHMKKMSEVGSSDGDIGQVRMKEGPMHIQRRRTFTMTMRFKRHVTGGEWKDRFCVLKKDALYMYKEKGDEKETQVVFLVGAKAEVEKDYDVISTGGEKDAGVRENCVFRIDAKSYEKNGKKYESYRTFVLAAENKEEMDDWIYMIRYVIESIEAAKMKKEGRDKRAMSRRSLSKEMSKAIMYKSPGNGGIVDNDDPETLDGEGDMRLVISIKRGKGLINPEAFGTSNPYCTLILDDQHCRTATPNSSSVNPSWEEDFVFPVELHQWVKSGLKIQIWNRDIHLSDDFLGYVDVDLSELVPEDTPVDSRLDSQVAAAKKSEDTEFGGLVGVTNGVRARGEELWLNLNPKKPYETARGALLIHVYLLMPASTSKRCQEAGGIEKFRQILQTEVLEAGAEERDRKIREEQRRNRVREMAS
ncbi:hypothetical protein TrRE_jg11242, partial [Triparma retinervis]